MKPWEKRLRDLAHLLQGCNRSYFEPELFRRNVNQFLQTARTVTFVMQSNKGVIPNFDDWYERRVRQEWAEDSLMAWARDSRNQIEKQGDLELHSTLRTTLIFSYLEEEDIVVECGRQDLVQANATKLVRFAQKHLPSSVSDVAVVKIERRWVANSLPDMELTNALRYIYGQHKRACRALAAHLGGQPEAREEDPLDGIAAMGDKVRHVAYVKLNGLAQYHLEGHRVEMDSDFKPPFRFQALVRRQGSERPKTLNAVLETFAEIAKLTFEEYGNHAPMLILLDDEWSIVDFLSAMPADQSDKYIFWRNAASRAIDRGARAAVWISESWIRKTSKNDRALIRNMPIIGERLHVVAFDQAGEVIQQAWKIVRDEGEKNPVLKAEQDIDGSDVDRTMFFLAPVRRAFGVVEGAAKYPQK